MDKEDGHPTRAAINRLLMTAALLAGLTAAIHIAAGTPEIQGPLLSSSFPQVVILELYAAWHLVSVTLILSAAALGWSATSRGASLAGELPRLVSALWLAFGVVFVVVDLVLAGPSGLLTAPQWTILFLVGILGLLGVRRRPIAST